jgi:hypothetical protein
MKKNKIIEKKEERVSPEVDQSKELMVIKVDKHIIKFDVSKDLITELKNNFV